MCCILDLSDIHTWLFCVGINLYCQLFSMIKQLVAKHFSILLGHFSTVFLSSVQVTCALSFAAMSLELKTIRVSYGSVSIVCRVGLMMQPLLIHKYPSFLLFQKTAVMTIMTMVRRKRRTTVETVTTRRKRLPREGRRPLKGKELQVWHTTLLSLHHKMPFKLWTL